MRPDGGFQHTRYPGPQRPGDHAADQHEREEDRRLQVAELDADRGAGDRAGQELALGADVEQASPEGQRYGDARGDQRNGENDGVGDLKGRVLTLGAVDPESAADQAGVRGQWVSTGDEDDERADDEREDDRGDRHGEAASEPAGRRQTRSGTGSCCARPRCLGYAGMSAGGVSAPDLISPWTLSSSA